MSDKLERSVEAMRQALGAPDARLTARVMAEVRRLPLPRKSRVAWISEPRVVRVRPWFVPLAAAALLAVWAGGARYGAARQPAGEAVAATARDTVYVRFEFAAPQARAVTVAGDFNGWKPDATTMVRGPRGVWVVTIPIGVGVHSYQFVVDGSTWVPDPSAGATDDGFGGHNSVIVVGPKGVVGS